MTRIYSGIFVKPFVLFFGEEIPYYIKEEKKGEMVVTESGHIRGGEQCPATEENRYQLLNDMITSWHMKDEKTLKKLLEQYREMNQLVQEKFTVI